MADHLAVGSAKDIEEYRKVCGIIEGLAWADIRQTNLQDPESWQETKRFVPVRDLLADRGEVYVASRDGVFRYNWSYTGPPDQRFFSDFETDDIVSLGRRSFLPAAAVGDGNFYRAFIIDIELHSSQCVALTFSLLFYGRHASK